MESVETVWAATSRAAAVLMIFLQGVCFGYFVKPYLRKKRTAACVGITYCAVMLTLYFMPRQIGTFTAYLCGVLAAFLVMGACERENFGQKIFLAATFFTLRWLAIAIAGEIDYLLYVRFVAAEGIAAKPWLQYGVYAATKLAEAALGFGMMMTAAFLLNRSYFYKREKLAGKELFMLLTPSLCGIFGYAILKFYMEVYERDTGKDVSAVYGAYAFLAALYYLASFLSVLVVVILFRNLKEGQMRRAEEMFLQGQLDSMKAHIAGIEKMREKERLLRHDVGNHLQTMQTLLEKGERAEASAYMESLKATWREATPEICSGHAVTDIVLTEKKNRARQKGIAFFCDFRYPDGNGLDAFDVSVILNNALDNCLEYESRAGCANGGAPYIRVRSYRKESVFLIEIENNCGETVAVNPENGLPLSTKQKAGHGIGLLSIKRTAEKYLGGLTFEAQDGKAVLTVMLQMKE